MTHTASHVLEKLMRSRTNLAVLCYSITNLCARLLHISQLSVTGEHHRAALRLTRTTLWKLVNHVFSLKNVPLYAALYAAHKVARSDFEYSLGEDP